jgi:hypothetical protein
VSRTPDLVGTSEAAAILGVEVPRITRWRKATPSRMPPTVADLAATPVWRRQDILKLKKLRAEPGGYGGDWPLKPPTRLELAGTSEAARIIGELLQRQIDKSQVGRWRRAGVFPEPLLALNATPIWTREAVERFAESRRRDPAAVA